MSRLATSGNFGTDYNLRAIVAVYGLAANLPVEAMYPVGSFDSSGELLDGANRYLIHIPKRDLPPVHYYWSFTAYNQDLYLVSNRISRYAINQFTPGVKYNKDGSLDIYVQSTAPAGHVSNWLPSPSRTVRGDPAHVRAQGVRIARHLRLSTDHQDRLRQAAPKARR